MGLTYKEAWQELKNKTEKDINNLGELSLDKINGTNENSRIHGKIEGVILTLENIRQLESVIDPEILHDSFIS